MKAPGKAVDPRTIAKVEDRVNYLYSNGKAMAEWAKWAAKNGHHPCPDDDTVSGVTLNKFWRATFTGETDERNDAPKNDGAPEGGESESGGYDLPDIDDEGNGQGEGGQGDQGGDQGEGDGQGEAPEPPPTPKFWEEEGDNGEKSETDLLDEMLDEDPGKGPEQSPTPPQPKENPKASGQSGQGQGAGAGGGGGEAPPKEHTPKWFERFEFYCTVKNSRGQHKPVLLVGPSGCGKTECARIMADHLKKPFFSVSCTDGMSEDQILGYPTPNLTTGEEHFHPGPLVRAVLEGGVILLDEADAMNPNTALILNSLLANGFLSIPALNDGKPVKAHPDFLPVFSMNTFGNGANRQYIGRNAQDSAFLSRLACQSINIDYDEELEKKICDPEVVFFGHRMRARCRFDDQKKPRIGWHRDISTRTLVDWSDQMRAKAPLAAAIYGFFEDWTEDELRKLRLVRNAEVGLIREK